MEPKNKTTSSPSDKKGEIVLYQPDESIRLEVRIEDETVWLTRLQMAELFGRDVKTIGKHVNNALKEELSSELLKFYGKEIKPVVANLRQLLWMEKYIRQNTILLMLYCLLDIE